MLDKSEITKQTPEKSLVEVQKRTGGRNSHGEVTAWHRGGGHQQKYRTVDFRREKTGIPAKVAAIEYDPNRSARIALAWAMNSSATSLSAVVQPARTPAVPRSATNTS